MAAADQPRGTAVDDAVERGPTARVRVAIGAALVLVVVALVASVLVTALSPVGATTVFGEGGDDGAAGASPAQTGSPSPAPGPPGPDADASVGETRAAILVHVLGSVVRPGVYELAEGSRAVDAVALAGGFAEGAEQASLNLARPLVDGEQLRVLAVGEAPPAVAGAPDPGAQGGPAGSAVSGAPGRAPGSAGGSPGTLINLNSATALDLDTLPRIGPAMAGRIIAWRDENGPFASVDDLLQITGIGDKTFESLRPLVTV